MRTRPRSIAILTTLFILFPLLLLISTLAESHFNFTKMLNTWSAGQSVLLMSSLIIAGAIWSVRPWGYFTCLGLVGCGILTSLISYARAPDMGGYIFLMTTVAMAAITAFLLQRHVAAPYFNPRQRWWETPTRYRAQFQVLASVQGEEIPVELIDISGSGCFVQKIDNLNPGDLLHVRIAFLDVRLELMSKVVRKSQKPIDGIGLMFMDLTRADRRDLELLLEHLQTHKSKAPTKTEDQSPTAA